MLNQIPLDIIGLISEYLYFESDRNNFKFLSKHVYNGFKKGKKRNYLVKETPSGYLAQFGGHLFVTYELNVWHLVLHLDGGWTFRIIKVSSGNLFLAKCKDNPKFKYICFMFDLILERCNAKYPKHDIRNYNKRIKLC